MILSIALLSCLGARGQQTNVVPTQSNVPNNGPSEAEVVMSNLLVQAGELVQTNEMSGTNELGQGDEAAVQTNELTQSNSPSQTAVRRQAENGVPGQPAAQSDDRRSRRRNRDRGEQSGSGSGSETVSSSDNGGTSSRADSGPTRADYSNFRIIAERNIFDPNRYPHQPGRANPIARRNPVVESFALVGVMSYEKGTFAFFNGTSSEYQKALKQDDTIAGYKVANIDPDTVKLEAGTNHVELHVGMQLRREDQGEWQASTQPEAYAAASSGGSASATSTSNISSTAQAPTTGQTETTSSGTESDVLKRLMQRREQE
ncbi:MAG TPA: hypothetical protein VN578_18340 [Candidatus Binatia bacterium]|nr:hypothetical protein [Candidatus Binatia bacterium]